MSGSNEFLKGTPAFVSIDASYTDGSHVHSLGDDLESILYVVLYCALLWLPVTSPNRTLEWWLTSFFHIPRHPGGGAPEKTLNASQRMFTKHLKSVKSPAILDWLNAAMDLHYSGGFPNPAWDDGKALGAMWKEMLDKDTMGKVSTGCCT